MINCYTLNILDYVFRYPEELQILVRPFDGKPLIKADIYQLSISNYIKDSDKPKIFFKDASGEEYQTIAYLDDFSNIGSTVHVPIIFTKHKTKEGVKVLCCSPIGYQSDNTIRELSVVNNNIIDNFITTKEYQNCMEVTDKCYLLFKNGIHYFRDLYPNIYSEFENRIMKTKLDNINNIQFNDYQDGLKMRRYY